jgi:hypothetical protein
MRETRPSRHAHGHDSEAGPPAVADPLLATPLSGEKEGRPHGADSPVEVVYVERAYARRSSVAWGDGL